LAASKHINSYGEFFLYDIVNGSPVYQHFAGIEYLYERGGHWLISDKIGLQVRTNTFTVSRSVEISWPIKQF
jgi:hypothetical protein